jgi:uncharacterized protein (TIGR01244 family)
MRGLRQALVTIAATVLLALAVWPVSQILRARAAPGEQESRPAKRPDPRHDNDYDVAAMFQMHVNPVSKDFTTGAQPTPEILKEFRDKGFKVVINLRPPHEHNAAEEEAAAKRLGLRYYNIPVEYRAPRFEQVDEFLKLTDDLANRPALVHCVMNIRAGAFFAIRRVLRDRWSFEDAEKEAAKGAEIAPHLRRFALEYIARHKKQ